MRFESISVEGPPLILLFTLYLSMRTLSEILRARAQDSSNGVTFLGEDGRVEDTLSYQDLFVAALSISAALLKRGFNTKSSTVIICSVNDMRSSILCFWACCLGMFIHPRAHNPRIHLILNMSQLVSLSAHYRRPAPMHPVKLRYYLILNLFFLR